MSSQNALYIFGLANILAIAIVYLFYPETANVSLTQAPCALLSLTHNRCSRSAPSKVSANPRAATDRAALLTLSHPAQKSTSSS